MCDSCGEIFSELAPGWQRGEITSVDPATGSSFKLVQDRCPNCAVGPTISKPRVLLDDYRPNLGELTEHGQDPRAISGRGPAPVEVGEESVDRGRR